MHFSLATVSILSAFIASVAASPTAIQEVHEKRNAIPNRWSKRSGAELDPNSILPVRIGLQQQNLHQAEDLLLEVSDPSSPKFGQHWSAKQVAEAFAPSDATINAVIGWLNANGISADRISQSQSLNWLSFKASVEETERLLKTKYSIYDHSDGHTHIACDEYSVPANIREHVDFITPTVHFDKKLDGPKKQKRTTTPVHTVKPGTAKSVGAPGSGSLPKKGASLGEYLISMFVFDLLTF
jgi:tripeptidyl-peptidase I